MPYLNCPRCQLSIEQRHGRPALEHCPRCLANLGQHTPLFRSPLALGVLDGRIQMLERS